MIRDIIKFLLILAALTNLTLAQDTQDEFLPSKKQLPSKDTNSVKTKASNELLPPVNEKKIEKDDKDIRQISPKVQSSLMPPKSRVPEEKSYKALVSSFRSNIKFGGFWNKYAVLNFSPSVAIQPFDFLSIYGNHRVSYFIPLSELKQEIKSLFIQGAAILAVDVGCKFFLDMKELIPAVVNYTLKASILELAKIFLKGSNNGVIHENGFYYAVSLRF